MKIKKLIKLTITVVLCLVVIGVASLFIINGYVKSAAFERLLTVEDASKLENIDCIIVLGCQVKTAKAISKTSDIDKYADLLATGNVIISLSSGNNYKNYNIVSDHAYSVQRIDKVNQKVYLANPWYGGGALEVSYKIFMNRISCLSIGYV